MLFDRQYILTEDVVVETRYRTETDTWTDEDGNSHTDTYQVPYDYYICTVTVGKILICPMYLCTLWARISFLLILAVAVLGGGAGWYFKIYRPKHEKAAVPEEDYSEELADYDDSEDDGPPWDEDDTESEDNE